MIRQFDAEMLQGWVAKVGGTGFVIRRPDFCSFQSPMGETIVLILYGTEGAFDELQIRCSWGRGVDDTKMPAALQIVDRWNRTRRFGKGFFDRDGDPVVEFHLDVEGGVAEENLTAFIRRALRETTRFAFEVVESLHEI